MEYFVSTENTAYYHWQMELLIESFKKNNCTENLLVAVAESSEPLQPHFCRNVYSHKRIYGHQNIGVIRGFKPLNEIYSLLWAQQCSLIKQPFAVMSTDMVLRSQLDIPFANDEYPEIVFAPNPFFTVDFVENNLGPFWEWNYKTREEVDSDWIPFGALTVFNNVPIQVFERVVMLAEICCLKQLIDGKEIWPQTVKLAWALALNDFIGQIRMRGDYTLTDTMLGSSNAALIHYEHGLPPVFNKTQFTYQPPNYVAFGDPFAILSEHAPTPNAHYMSMIAETCLNARN